MATLRIGLLFLILPLSVKSQERPDLTQYVDPLIGTGGHGHTFPGATLPFGMVQLSPDTRTEGWDACGGYHYSDTTMLGFSHTHLSGTGIADYGDILVTPGVGNLPDGKRKFPMRFDHSDESASPGYYSVKLKNGIHAELTATRRVGIHRYTFPSGVSASLLFDLFHGLGTDNVTSSGVTIVDNREISGYRFSKGWATDQRVFFAAQFSEPFVEHELYDGEIQVHQSGVAGTAVRCMLRFNDDNRRPIVVKVALSGVSVDGARENLYAEMKGWDFDEVKRAADSVWNSELSNIVVEGGSRGDFVKFYTALYHSMIAPNLQSDVDGRYRGMDGSVRVADGFDMYSVFSLWDTFRGLHPLLTIIQKERSRDFAKSLLEKYRESGLLPVWELASNETFCMIGYHSVSVLLDAYRKGIMTEDGEEILRAMVESATRDHFGLDAYKEAGFISKDRESESVSKTLEYAYNDWCIAEMARALGRDSLAHVFKIRASSFQNVFDPESGHMRPRMNGAWVEPFDPTSVSFHYTEANAWQYSFFVPHDIASLIGLAGGREKFIRKLDSLFMSSSTLSGREQADITGLIGQYAHGNEPSHHVAYLYNYAGVPWKTQSIVRRIMDSLYTEGPEGLCGNDDCGQLSAWFVLSALGMYQVCPGDPVFTLGSPLFQRATISTGWKAPNNASKYLSSFIVTSTNGSVSHPYIQAAILNGHPHEQSYLTWDQLEAGGMLQLDMGSVPNRLWAHSEEAVPPSASSLPVVAVPWIRASSSTFTDSIVVTLGCVTGGAAIHYSIDDEDVDTSSPAYIQPIVLRETAILRARSGLDSARSQIVRSVFTKRSLPGTISLGTRYSEQYTGGGDIALIDGIRGARDFRLGAWQGYHENDCEVVIDLGKVKTIEGVSLGALQDINSWIFLPEDIEFRFSQDSVSFSSRTLGHEIPLKMEGSIIHNFVMEDLAERARYVSIKARNIGRCPDWHKGAGGKAWIFVDEISITVAEK